jgi:hypothetical protein
MNPLKIWDSFCERMQIHDNAVPLFQTDQLNVKTKLIGKQTKKSILVRSSQMENLIHSETDILTDDWEQANDQFDGLIYMVFYKNNGSVIPLYIGKAETIGKGERNLSVNIKSLRTDKSKFARWGDSYAYHIGDLSAAVLPGHEQSKINKKYTDWAKTLFIETPTLLPKLRQEVYFWCKAWDKKSTGIWEDFGPTRLTFLEYLLIGVASAAFPDVLLNREGQNRG